MIGFDKPTHGWAEPQDAPLDLDSSGAVSLFRLRARNWCRCTHALEANGFGEPPCGWSTEDPMPNGEFLMAERTIFSIE